MTGNIERLLGREQIELILAISRSGSFSAAALVLGVTPSSVSQQVKRLESDAGCALFKRERRGVSVTLQCEAVISYARAVTALTSELRHYLGATGSSPKVGIGLAEDFCRTALPSILALFSSGHSHIDLRIISGDYALLARSIAAKEIDIAVMRRWDQFPDARPLWSDEQTWYGRADFRLLGDAPVPLVVPLAPNPTGSTLTEALRDAGRSWRVRFESVGMTGIEAALQCGLGICGGPRSMPMHGVIALQSESGLPALPRVDFVMVGPHPGSSAAAFALAEVVQHAMQLRRTDAERGL